MEKISRPRLKIAALGDISFAGANADNPTIDLFSQVKHIFDQADVVAANLEGPLYDHNHAIPGKCTIRGNTGWAAVLKTVGIDIVSLANNHIMDHGTDGLFSTISVLNQNDIKHVGAGVDILEACKPIFIEIKRYRLAVLARTSVIVESPSYADEKTPGVAFLDIQELVDNVKTCRKKADAVVLLMHWGLEHYSYPTPSQKKLAKTLIAAGVDMIIGHHPHVVQGVERFGRGLVAYSLGNFVFDEFEWTINSGEESKHNLKLKLTPLNRKGIIFTATIKDKKIEVTQAFTRISESGAIYQDDTSQRVHEFDQLCMRLRKVNYGRWWKLYALKKEWELRLQHRITAKNVIFKIFRLRPEHARDLFRMIRNSCRISSEKSTNPYE